MCAWFGGGGETQQSALDTRKAQLRGTTTVGGGPHSSNPNDRPSIGAAVPKDDPTAPPDAPPSTAQHLSTAAAEAAAAAARQRKRASAGNTILTGAQAGTGLSPKASLAPRTLIGH